MVASTRRTTIILALMAVAVGLCFLAIAFSGTLTEKLGGTGVSMAYESELFDTSEVMSVDIQMDEDSWNAMLANAISEEYYACDVTINGTTVKNVAIRPKGNTSLSSIAMDPDTDRYSLKLEFDHFVDGQTCYGLDKLILNNNYADATNMKEAIVYDMYQYLGADASLYNYAKVYVNGEYWGVYLALEGVEESFMLRNYGTQDGELYKPDSMEMGGGEGGASAPSMGGVDFSDIDMSEFEGMTPPQGMDKPNGIDGSSDSNGKTNGDDKTEDTSSALEGVSTQTAALRSAAQGPSGMPSFGGPGGGGMDFDPNNMPEDFDPNNMPEGMPEDFDPNNMPEGAPEGFDPNSLPEGTNVNATPESDSDSSDTENDSTSAKPDTGGSRPSGMGGFSMGNGGANLNYTDDELDSYSTIWSGEITGTSKADHRRVVTALKHISEGDELETYLDVDNVLKYMAVHAFVVNMDSLSGSMAHNYYLYEYDGQLNILPWDYNLSFGGMSMSGDASSVVNDAIDTPFSGTQFFDALLENDEYRARYHAYLQQLVNEYVKGGRFDEVYNRIRSQIDELVETDPTAFYSYDEYQTAAQMLYDTVQLRAQSIAGQLDGTIPSTDAGQREDSSALVDASGIDIEAMGQMDMGGGSGDRSDGSSEDDASSEDSADSSDSDSSQQPQAPEGFGQGSKPSGSSGFAPGQMNILTKVKKIAGYALCFVGMVAALVLACRYQRKGRR